MQTRRPQFSALLAALALAAAPAFAAAPTPEDDYGDYAAAPADDPFEGINRRVFAFNDTLYARVLRPATRAYEFVVRPPINRAFANFYDNVRYPVRLANCLLQGKVSRADLETRKFAVNTLAGLGGFIRQSDQVPALADVPAEDLGQTLGVWGVPRGPYLVLPVLGGMSARDAGGRVADTLISPLGWDYTELGGLRWSRDLEWETRAALTVTNTLSELPSALDLYDQTRASAIDPYIAVRDGLRGFRDAQTRR